MNKNLHTRYTTSQNCVDSFNIIEHNMPQSQNECSPQSTKVYVGGLPVNVTSDEVLLTEIKNLKCTKIPFSLKLHLSALEKSAKFGFPSVRRALLSLNLKSVVLLKVFFCLPLIGSIPVARLHPSPLGLGETGTHRENCAQIFGSNIKNGPEK